MSNLPPLVDEVSLAQYLKEHLPSSQADLPLTSRKIGTGHSNETFLITRGNEEFVLRRPPRGPLLPTAHDVAREYKVISGLSQSELPVPRPILLCTDESIIGAPFYLMAKVDGLVIYDSLPAVFDTLDGKRELAEELVRTLVKLHAVDYRAVGLGDLGKSEGYLERQLKRWTGQLDKSRTRQIRELDLVSEWLKENLPESPAATIVHGDYRLDNAMYAPQRPAQILAVVDWEMATLGDPLADLGYLISYWREPGDPPSPFPGQLGSIVEQPGFPTRQEMISLYENWSGRKTNRLDFYVVLAIWKLAILLEGSYVRHKAGTTDDPFFELLEEGVPALARRAWNICRTGEIK